MKTDIKGHEKILKCRYVGPRHADFITSCIAAIRPSLYTKCIYSISKMGDSTLHGANRQTYRQTDSAGE